MKKKRYKSPPPYVSMLRARIKKLQELVAVLGKANEEATAKINQQTQQSIFASGHMLYRYTTLVTPEKPRWGQSIFSTEEPACPETQINEVPVKVLYEKLVECVRMLEPWDVPDAYKIAFGQDPPPRPKKTCATCGREER